MNDQKRNKDLFWMTIHNTVGHPVMGICNLFAAGLNTIRLPMIADSLVVIGETIHFITLPRK